MSRGEHVFGKKRKGLLYVAIGASLVTGLAGLSAATHAKAATSADWPTYLRGPARSGYNSAESAITASTVGSMQNRWTDTSGSVSAEPVVSNGVVYYGSWDGRERAVSATNGAQLWSTYIGQTTDGSCKPTSTGVASTATVGTITRGGVATRVVLVGGGNHNFYALNAATGAVIWKRQIGATSSTFLWSSPLLYKGLVYEGIASFGDCPLVRGGIDAIQASTGKVVHTLYTAPSGCTGAGVWGSPTVDTSTGDIYFGTGNANATCNEPLSVAVVEASSSLSLLSSWQIPSTEHGPDSDFGSTPTLFTSGGAPMLGLQNKNGVYYAFHRGSVGSGPVWKTRIAKAGECPQCGNGDISSSAWDGTSLYVGGGNTTIQGTKCLGSADALRPSNGTIIWQNCLTGGPVIAAVTAVPGVVFLGEGGFVQAFGASTGNTLFSHQDSNSGSDFWGPASIASGSVYIGNQDGDLFAFSP
jgi:polyvinyl alcohol dehydrogenase (cytochrome)